MTYTPGNPPAMTPEAKLANPRWRYTNSWWIFPPVLSFGFLGWLGFLVAAAQTGERKYWIFSGLYASLFAAFMTMILIDPDGLISDLAAIPFLAAWLGPTIHAAIINRRYLTTLANKGPWYAQPSTQPMQNHPTEQGGFLGVSTGNYYSPQPPIQPAPQAPPPGNVAQQARAFATTPPPQPQVQHPPSTEAAPQRVNVAHATIEALTSLPGITPALAKRIIDIRDARGGYRNFDDLASAANLQPHELVRIRDHLTFESNEQAAATDTPRRQGTPGRILDI